MRSELMRSGQARLGLGILALFAVVAALGPLCTRDPAAFLASPLLPPNGEFWLGTTRQGQDVFAQLIVGTRSSLGVGLSVGFLVMVIGSVVGLTAAYFGGLIDEILSLILGIFLILPGLPLAVLLAAFVEAGPLTIALVLVITGWAWNARVVRAQALALRQRDFVLSAIALGEHPLRIMLVEMLPNMTSIVFSSFIGATMHAIGAQVGLEFLGLGDVSRVTWGTNLFWAVTNQDILTESWWTILPTGLSIALFGFALACINYGIDEVTSPRLHVSRAYTALVGPRMGLRRLITPVVKDEAVELPAGKAV
jgi:peptide/nickel transport system permease protein